MKNNIPIELRKRAGIYQINNFTTGKVYIGSTVWFASRFNSHSNPLKRGNHPNKYLQASYNKFGASDFEFTPIRVLDNIEGETKRDRAIRLMNAENEAIV